MIYITVQNHISIPILIEKLKDREHRIAINLLTPQVGIVVDGHHAYIASLIDHKPLRIVTAGLGISENNTGAGLLDYWQAKYDGFTESKEWSFYDLMTGKPIPVKTLKNWVDLYPDFVYTI